MLPICSSIRTWSAIIVVMGALAGTAPAQRPAAFALAPASPVPAAPARVLILGTYHFANPGFDVVKTEVVDVLSPEKQAEIGQVVDALLRFRPTKIAVEASPESGSRINSVYRAYRAGRYTLSRNEIDQLGFRLAARLGHARLYPIDRKGEFPFDAMMAYAQKHDSAFVRYVEKTIAEVTAEENRRQQLSIAQNLRTRNDPRQLAKDHAVYLRFARVGAGDTYVGADLLSEWYDRNIRIFANLERIAEPGDRILVIFGSGHAPILRSLVQATPDMVLVEAGDYLPPS